MASSGSMAGIPSLIGYASLLVGQTMSWRASEKYTGAFDTGHASISMSLESMGPYLSRSARRRAGRRDAPAERDRHADAHHLLAAGPLDQRAVHRGDTHGRHHEPDAALQRHAGNTG